MQIAISNLAWDIDEDDAISHLLQKQGITAIDIVPNKYFGDISKISTKDMSDLKSWWAKKDINLTGMQALLFGQSHLNLFLNPKTRYDLLNYLRDICHLAAHLNAPRLVFGSAKNRDKLLLSNEETNMIASDFFYQLGNIAQKHNVIFCLEPIPHNYNCNFLNNSIETAIFVEQLNHPYIRLQLDTGAVTINQENIMSLLSNYGHLIGHIHISEPQLLPIGDSYTDHANLSNSIKRFLPHHLISIEMLATQHENHLSSIERSLITTKTYYS